MNRLGSLLVLVLTLSMPAWAQSRGAFEDVRQMPEGKPGEHVEAILAVIESGEEDQIRALVNERFAPRFRDAFPRGDDPIASTSRNSRPTRPSASTSSSTPAAPASRAGFAMPSAR